MKQLKFPKEVEKDMINQIQRFFLEEKNEELGELAASIFLDFIIEKIGPAIYNQGIYDSHKFLSNSLDDLLSITK